MRKLRTYIQTLIDRALDKRMGEITAQVAEEAQTAVQQIKEAIIPQVATVTQTLLQSRIGQLDQLTQDNLQMFQTTLQVLNAGHANHKALIKLLEPYILPDGDLADIVARHGFRYQVDYALGDLDKNVKAGVHPAILEHLNAKIGKLYNEARNTGMIEEFNAAVQEHTFNWMEGYHEPTHTSD